MLTPFASLDGYERRIKTIETTAAVAAGMQAWKAGRSKSQLLEGEDVPKQYPAARPFASRAGRRGDRAELWGSHGGKEERVAAADGGGGHRGRRRGDEEK